MNVKKDNRIITFRSNSFKDMADKIIKKYPDYYVFDKGGINDNFGMGGFKYYQHFWLKLK